MVIEIDGQEVAFVTEINFKNKPKNSYGLIFIDPSDVGEE